ncbi:MAG: DNA-3-methyladenine glycosylase family protein [Sulfurifustis sp.]
MTRRSALGTRAPFHLEATVRVLQRRLSNRVDVWEQGRYLRAFATAKNPVLVEVENHGTIDRPDVRCAFRGDVSAATEQCVRQAVRKILGLDIDPERLTHFADAGQPFRSTLLALRGMRPPRFADLFETFASVVPFQQLSLDAGVAIVGRLVERFGESIEREGRRYYAFPAAQRIAVAHLERLQSCGLSAQKAQTLSYLARIITSGTLSEAELVGMSTPDALRRLVDLPGIGPWSAALVLLRGLGRIDVFPPGDVGAERGLRALLRLSPRTSLGRVIERFGDRRGYLYFCALGGGLLAKGLIHAAPYDDGRHPRSGETVRQQSM